jgi:hypothetical protein
LHFCQFNIPFQHAIEIRLDSLSLVLLELQRIFPTILTNYSKFNPLTITCTFHVILTAVEILKYNRPIPVIEVNIIIMTIITSSFPDEDPLKMVTAAYSDAAEK